MSALGQKDHIPSGKPIFIITTNQQYHREGLFMKKKSQKSLLIFYNT